MGKDMSSLCGLLFLCCKLLGLVVGGVAPQGPVQTECRDRYFWVSVDLTLLSSAPRFEAVDALGTHRIDANHAAECGYTLSIFKMNGRATLRASYFSCHTENQDDRVFHFKFNIAATDMTGQGALYPVTETCAPTLGWAQREVICEENYVEVTVKRDSPCTSDEGTSKQVWQAALSVARRTAMADWQLMFLRDQENMDVMPVEKAHQLGYVMDATQHMLVFRSAYQQPHSEIITVDGIAVEILQVTAFFRQKWMVVMIDMSAACSINPGTFNGRSLLWAIPRIIPPLVHDQSRFLSKQIHMGVEGQLLSDDITREMGYMLKDDGNILLAVVPFGAEGGYRMSLVENNVYKESYVIFLYFEHMFSHAFGDGSEVDTRHRLLRVLGTPLLCRIPITEDRTVVEQLVFTVFLGNLAADVRLEAVKLNKYYMSISAVVQRGYPLSVIPGVNNTHGYVIEVPFQDKLVHRAYLGDGRLRYSLDLNYTLNIIPLEDQFYHIASVEAHLNNAFPPDVGSECVKNGIIFKMDKPSLEHQWEVGIGQHPLTAELAKQQGYVLKADLESVTVAVPLFTAGYTYEDITLTEFYGSFEILIRDSKTLDVVKRTEKRCPFKTEELIVCSPDGTMTVVVSTANTRPVVEPSHTTLLDKTCRPKECDDTKALFSFGLNTCGTKATVTDSYIIYENEILFLREGFPKENPIITRDSTFRLTVKCYYPLSSTNRIFVGKMKEEPGFGSVEAGDTQRLTSAGCSLHDYASFRSRQTADLTPQPRHLAPVVVKPGSNHFGTVGRGNQQLGLETIQHSSSGSQAHLSSGLASGGGVQPMSHHRSAKPHDRQHHVHRDGTASSNAKTERPSGSLSGQGTYLSIGRSSADSAQGVLVPKRYDDKNWRQ